MDIPVEPQPVLTPLTEAAIFLVATVDAGKEDAARELLADVPGIARSVGFRIPDGELQCVAAVGSELWDRMLGSPKPQYLHPFVELAGVRHRAPRTDGDLLFHLRARRMDLCFELAGELAKRLPGAVVDEVHGFKYFDERDLLGFVDGTENPTGASAHAAALLDLDSAFPAGSYVVVQKYVHDLTAWNALTVEQQELAVGRTKLTNIELPDEQKPPNSHLALNVIENDNGEELKIVRDNMPFGQAGGESGTYFISYAADPRITERMLHNMFIGDPPGTTDRLLDFSTAVTGGMFFAPSATFLDGL